MKDLKRAQNICSALEILKRTLFSFGESEARARTGESVADPFHFPGLNRFEKDGFFWDFKGEAMFFSASVVKSACS
ncbi:hypothetical protein OIU84_006489 [Salix udensis]|uniref:Uncharacterized protein n=1 Tax=Salix udensis TaxID=889485 RepID=A0AAD6JYH9_9ROSI|nr:hypothetical protein OIU84_006489 [Salix udensis]